MFLLPILPRRVGSTFVFGAVGLRLKSRSGQIEHSVANSSPPLRHFFKRSWVARARWRGDWLVNGPTSSDPNTKTNLKPKSCPKKTESLKNFSVIAKYFWSNFCAPKTKSTCQARITVSPNLVTLGPNRTRPEKPGSTYNSAPRWALLTRYTLRRIAVSVMKDLIWTYFAPMGTLGSNLIEIKSGIVKTIVRIYTRIGIQRHFVTIRKWRVIYF